MKKTLYIAPELSVQELYAESVLCVSDALVSGPEFNDETEFNW